MSSKLWDVIIVGGGPAGITAALRLARENLDILVIEAGVYPGAENWSGAVYFAENLADPLVLGADELEEAPFERRVVKRGFFSCNGLTMAGVEYRNPETFRYCYTVLRPVYDRYLAEVARARGVTFLNETTVDGLIRRGEVVVGVHTDRGPVYGNIVFLAEGDASHLVSKEGFERDAVRSKSSGQPAFLQGVKEVIQLEPQVIEERFGVGAGEAACYEILLRNGAVDGKPVRLNMAGLLYTNRDSVSIGLVMPLENLATYGGDYNALMEWYKGLPPIARLIEGGQSTSYGAKIIRGGGLNELPRLVDHGVAVGGAATGIGVDFPYPNYTGPATAMGRIFADAVLQLRAAEEHPRSERLEELYVEPLKQTHYYKDVQHLRDWPAFIEHSEALFGRQIDVLNGSLYVMTRPQLSFPRQWWEAVRMIGETMKGRWSRTLKDLSKGSKALHIGRSMAKHAPVALLLSIPNTLLAFIPFVYGKGPGELGASFWVKDEPSGVLPWYKRWAIARYRSALAKAASIVYSNDGAPLARKLDRAVGVVARRFSLWELNVGIPGFVLLLLTRGVQKLSDAIRYAIRVPTLEQLTASFYGSWMTRWRRLTDLTPGAFTTATTHDAKLSEITYGADVGSHIKVFFPAEKSGKLDDPTRSSLWSVCPAAVYQVNVDRTLHASVTVNFENCVKCETCWRIEPQHVDWSRFGSHRLTYEVYTAADGALRRALADRQLQEPPEIEPSFWNATLSDDWPGAGSTRADEALRDAVTEARRAIDRAVARCAELSENIWLGPRVLEPGQVTWYAAALEYYAVMAEEAASITLAEPIEDWLAEHELAGAHVQLLQLKKDLERMTKRIREHAGANRFFNGEADARQLRDHHLAGMRDMLDRIAVVCLISDDYPDPVAELRASEVESAARGAARTALREQLATIFDRSAIRRLEGGGALQKKEIEALAAAIRAALGQPAADGFTGWATLGRGDILAELSRVDPSLAALVAAHLAGVEALESADAPVKILDPLKRADTFVAIAAEADAVPAEDKWGGTVPFVFAALAGQYVVRGGRRVALFQKDKKHATLTATPAIGLAGAGVSELALKGAKPVWEDAWSERDEAALFASRAHDTAAIALGSATILTERAVDHARSRIQFPDMFQDLDGRDGVGKFGAVRAHLAHLEAARLAVETILHDADWAGGDGLEAVAAKVAVSDLFGPDMPSITYRAGQVIGGSAFSEEDIFSKAYRDSSVFPHYIRENAELNVEIGRRIASNDGSPLATIAPQLADALDAMARRPIFDFEVHRLHEAEMRLAETMRATLSRGNGAAADEVIYDTAGELATRLYAWARLLVRAHRRLEGALPAERYVEAAQLWADVMEERLIELEEELAQAAERVELGGYAFQLGEYPDVPIATEGLGFDHERDIVNAGRNHRSGDFLLKPFSVGEIRYVPELVWADAVTRAHYEEYLREIRERIAERALQPSYERHIEKLHYIPREDIDWTVERGYFRVVIPKEYGGQGRTKADYYNLCQISKRHADVSHTLTIQANTSIGTTPMLLGLEEVNAAERDLQGAVDRAADVEAINSEIAALIAMMATPEFEALKNKYIEIDKLIRGSIGKSRVLKKVIFGRFQSAWGKAGAAGMKGDLPGFKKGLEKSLAALDGWQQRTAAELQEMPRRRTAHEFYLKLIAARIISAFSLTEPSAGSDTARVRTEARLESRGVHTDEDGVKFFYVDEEQQEGRRNIGDMRRFEFDGRRILYRYRDDAEPAEVLSQEYVYEHEKAEKYRYFMIGDRRVDIHDMALTRERDGAEVYEFFVLNGAKMWITNGHIAGVNAIYARTPMGLTGFMVDALTEGFLVGKDEEKTGQRGSPTNEISLVGVRIPRECMIGIEGRGQENALETLNVGRTGLCVSSAVGIEQGLSDAARYLERLPRGANGWVRYRLGLAMEEMFAVQSISFNLIGIYDDDTSDMPRVESSIAKLYGTDGLHRMLHFMEPVYGIDGQTQRYRIEKDRRDARVMTIYEGTNEIQQFLLLKDLIDMVGPKLEKLDEPDVAAPGSPFEAEVAVLREMHATLRDRVKSTRATYKSAAWQRALLQPIFFRLANMAALVKAVDSTVHRADWIARKLTADGDELRRQWTARAARGFVARARREFQRLLSGFDRDFVILRDGGRPSELKLAETLFDESEAATAATESDRRIERTPVDRDLKIVVALEWAPHLAPRPRVSEGRLAEHVYGFTAGDRRALRLALELKRAAPHRVRVTLITAAPHAAEDALRAGLAAGADGAFLLDTAGASYEEHAVAEAVADALLARQIDFHLLLTGASDDSPSGGRLGLRLAGVLEADCVPSASDLWVADDGLVLTSERFPDMTIRAGLPSIVSVAGVEGEEAPAFSTAGFTEALRSQLRVIAFPAKAARLEEELATAGAAAAGAEGDEAGRIDPERAAELMVEVGDLGDGASGPAATPYDGEVRKATVSDLEWHGVVFIAELEDDDLEKSARSPLDAAASLAARSSLPLLGLVLAGKLTDARRRTIAGRLAAYAPFTRIVFAESSALAGGAMRAYSEALQQLVGPGAKSRPSYLVSSPWLAEAMPALAETLRDADLKTDELAGVTRVEFRDGDGVAFVHPAYERKLRARRQLPMAPDGIRIVWFEAEVTAGGAGAEAGAATVDVLRVTLELEYDPQTDALAEALAEAKKRLGVVTLENAEFLIDVGAGLGSVDNLETVVEPLRRALLEMGAPHVLIGATRKVTMDMSWLPEEHQIGQTGVRVNPRIMIALGVSGAPQHIDWVGDRAVIFAFNLDPQAPLMTLNQRREQPKVYPVVGNLLETVPRFITALKRSRKS